MPFPRVLYAAALSQALPLIAALSHRGRPLPAPVRWLLAWCALGLATDALSMALVLARSTNTWIQYVAVPLSSGFVLWALSGWQQHEVLRLAYRLVIPALGLATMAVLLALPPAPTFDQLVAPFHALVVLAASLHTVVHRSLRSEGPLVRESWFWIGLGLSLYFAGSVAIRPFAVALLASNIEWVRQAWLARAWMTILAFALITAGILCHRFPRQSGGRS